jgi:hypothetical protein
MSLYHYVAIGITFGPQPEQKWQKAEQRPFVHHVLATSISDCVDLVKDHEMALPFAEDISTSHSNYIYHDPSKVDISSIEKLGKAFTILRKG